MSSGASLIVDPASTLTITADGSITGSTLTGQVINYGTISQVAGAMSGASIGTSVVNYGTSTHCSLFVTHTHTFTHSGCFSRRRSLCLGEYALNQRRGHAGEWHLQRQLGHPQPDRIVGLLRPLYHDLWFWRLPVPQHCRSGWPCGPFWRGHDCCYGPHHRAVGDPVRRCWRHQRWRRWCLPHDRRAHLRRRRHQQRAFHWCVPKSLLWFALFWCCSF